MVDLYICSLLAALRSLLFRSFLFANNIYFLACILSLTYSCIEFLLFISDPKYINWFTASYDFPKRDAISARNVGRSVHIDTAVCPRRLCLILSTRKFQDNLWESAAPVFRTEVCCGGTMHVYRVLQEEGTKLREGVPYVKLYRKTPKHLYPKLNGLGDNGN
jgi:hypothetical protein